MSKGCGLMVWLSMYSVAPPIDVHASPITTPGGVISYSRSERKIRWPMYCSRSFAWIVKSVESISDWLIVARRIATFR